MNVACIVSDCQSQGQLSLPDPVYGCVCWLSMTCRAESSPGTNPAATGSSKQLPPKAADTKALESKSLKARGGVHFGGGGGSDGEEEGRDDDDKDEDGPPVKAKSAKVRLHETPHRLRTLWQACVELTELITGPAITHTHTHTYTHAALLGEDLRRVMLLRLTLLFCP